MSSAITLRGVTNELLTIYSQREAREIAMRLFEFHTGYSRAHLLLETPLSEAIEQKIRADITRLLDSEPIQYVLSEAYFYGEKFWVTPDVLIPRRETEELVTQIITDLKDKHTSYRLLDIGTGSGCIAITLAKHLPKARVIAVDVSPQALAVAKRNALHHHVSIEFVEADVFTAFYERIAPFDVLVSNPPYVTEGEKKLMMRSVTAFEPSLALFVPNEKPLLYYERIATIAATCLPVSGLVYWEINENFGSQTQKLLENQGFRTWLLTDMQHKNRFVKAIKK